MILIQNADVLSIPAHALIYSTNVLLNCSGGVGACLVQRFGKQVQVDLHRLLARSGRRSADQGEIFRHTTPAMPYIEVFHTCPCDGWYETTTDTVTRILQNCLGICSDHPAISSIALSALATGYGRLSMEDFVRTLAALNIPNHLCITLAIDDAFRFEQIRRQVEAESLAILNSPGI